MENIITYTELIISLISIIMIWLQGNKDINGWYVNILCQLVWIIYMFLNSAWGFLPLNIAMWFILVRNIKKWSVHK
jgi:hypothetical protein